MFGLWKILRIQKLYELQKPTFLGSCFCDSPIYNAVNSNGYGTVSRSICRSFFFRKTMFFSCFLVYDTTGCITLTARRCGGYVLREENHLGSGMGEAGESGHGRWSHVERSRGDLPRSLDEQIGPSSVQGDWDGSPLWVSWLKWLRLGKSTGLWVAIVYKTL